MVNQQKSAEVFSQAARILDVHDAQVDQNGRRTCELAEDELVLFGEVLRDRLGIDAQEVKLEEYINPIGQDMDGVRVTVRLSDDVAIRCLIELLGGKLEVTIKEDRAVGEIFSIDEFLELAKTELITATVNPVTQRVRRLEITDAAQPARHLGALASALAAIPVV